MVYNPGNRQVNYEEAVGIISLDTVERSTIGTGGTAINYPFPVIVQKVKGLSFEKLYTKDRSFRDQIIEVGKDLVRQGAKLITGNCGYMAQYQKDLANELEVPVFMSSLLQVPFVSRMLHSDEKVGIVCANSAELDDSILLPVGIDNSCPISIKGLEDKEHFHHVILKLHNLIDSDRIKLEVVDAVKEMVEEDLKIKAIVFECTLLPAYAYAVQEVVNLPIFDHFTLINYMYSSIVRK